MVISRDEANKRGLKKFYTGIPCKKGHLAERWVSTNGCTHCLNPRLSTPEGAPASGLSHDLVWALPRFRINRTIPLEQQAEIFSKMQGWLDHCTEELGIPSARQLGHPS